MEEIDFDDYICLTLFDDYAPFRKINDQIYKRQYYYNSALLACDQRDNNEMNLDECLGVVALVDREMRSTGQC